MSYLPVLLVGVVGMAIFFLVWVMPRRRRTRQEQTIDRDPVPPSGTDEPVPGSRPYRADRDQP